LISIYSWISSSYPQQLDDYSVTMFSTFCSQKYGTLAENKMLAHQQSTLEFVTLEAVSKKPPGYCIIVFRNLLLRTVLVG